MLYEQCKECMIIVANSLFSLFLGARDKGYGTFHEEAIRIFSSLQEQESVADPIPVIQVGLLAIFQFTIGKALIYGMFGVTTQRKKEGRNFELKLKHKIYKIGHYLQQNTSKDFCTLCLTIRAVYCHTGFVISIWKWPTNYGTLYS